MKYSESHEWVKIDGDVAVVGVSDHAQQELGEIVYVELPEVGKEIAQKEEAAVLESTKAAADIYSPVSGTIVAVNDAVVDAPETVNEDAEGEGWLFKLKLSQSDELKDLLDTEAYQALTSG